MAVADANNLNNPWITAYLVLATQFAPDASYWQGRNSQGIQFSTWRDMNRKTMTTLRRLLRRM